MLWVDEARPRHPAGERIDAIEAEHYVRGALCREFRSRRRGFARPDSNYDGTVEVYITVPLANRPVVLRSFQPLMSSTSESGSSIPSRLA